MSYFFLFGFVCFSNPTSPPRSPIGSVPCVPSYTLSPSAFKGVTHGMSFKHTSAPLCFPWHMQVRLRPWSKPTKECLATVKQVFFHYQEGSLVDHQAYKPYTLVGPPALRLD